MSCPRGLVLAVLLVAVGRPAQAQVPAAVGGFGFDYAQPIPANGYVLNRWWMVQPTPAMGNALPPSTAVQQPVMVQPASPVRVTRSGRIGRSLSRVSARPYNRTVVQPGAPLPTGSLYWAPAPGTALYSPAQRYASYGQGYGVSPYGSAYYGAQYKGMYWGN